MLGHISRVDSNFFDLKMIPNDVLNFRKCYPIVFLGHTKCVWWVFVSLSKCFVWIRNGICLYSQHLPPADFAPPMNNGCFNRRLFTSKDPLGGGGGSGAEPSPPRYGFR